LFGKLVYINIRLPRYQCEKCDKKTTQQTEWHKRNSSFTVPYEKQIKNGMNIAKKYSIYV